MSDAAIELVDVNKWYGTFHVLKNINLTVGKWRKGRNLWPVWIGQVHGREMH